MAFTPEQPRAPASIGDISVILTDYVDEETPDTASYEVQVLQADGSMFRLAMGNLAPYLTPQQVTALQNFMAAMRTLAQGLLPEGG